MSSIKFKLNLNRFNYSTNDTFEIQFVLMLSAILGVIIGGLILVTSAVISTVSVAPIAFLVAIPALIGSYITVILFAIIVVPLWVLIGGFYFARMYSGKTGNLVTEMQVTLLPENHPIVLRIQEMAKQLKLPPIAYIGHYDSDTINAFAAGLSKDNAMICFSKGAVGKLTGEQFMAVMAHELAHILNGDMRRMTIARGIQRSLTWFLYFQGLRNIASWIFTPLSELRILSLSRTREFYADAFAAVLVSSDDMIGTLKVIERDKTPPMLQEANHANFMFHGDYFKTHPSLERRINAIKFRTYFSRLPLIVEHEQNKNDNYRPAVINQPDTHGVIAAQQT